MSPAEAVKGTELIRLARLRLGDDYSDATLRYFISPFSLTTLRPQLPRWTRGRATISVSKRNGTTPGRNPAWTSSSSGPTRRFPKTAFLERVLAIF